MSAGPAEGMPAAGGGRIERLARTAYEAHRSAHPTSLPPWEQTAEDEQRAWRAAVSAVSGQAGATVAEPARSQALVIDAGDGGQVFRTDFTVGRQGNLVIDDEYASSNHARFRVAHGLWYVEDLRSTNGTWLNGRRIHAPQLLRKGDRIKIGHTVMTVMPELSRAQERRSPFPFRTGRQSPEERT